MSTAPQKPLTIDQTIALAVQKHRTGASAEAVGLLVALVKQEPRYIPSLATLGQILYEMRDFVGAATAFEAATKVAPDNVPLKLMLGDAAVAGGRADLAVKVYDEAVKLAPDHAIAWNKLGAAREALGNVGTAADAYRAAIAAQPAHVLGHLNLGNLLLSQQNYVGAEAQLMLALKVDPRNVSAWHHLGVSLMYQRKFIDAEKAFRAGLAKDAKFFPSLRSLGTLMLETGRKPEGIELLRAADKLRPGDPQTETLLGTALLSLEKEEEGFAKLLAALEHDPRNVDTRLLLVNFHLQKGRNTEAMLMAFAGLQLDSQNESLRRAAVSAMDDQTVVQMTPPNRQVLMALINDPTIRKQNLAHVVVDLAKQLPCFKPMLEAARKGQDALAVAGATAIMSDDLLLAILPSVLVCDEEMELVLTAIRREFLLRASITGFPFKAPQGANGPFLAALARHSFTNEYATYVAPDEQTKIDRLRAQLEGVLSEPSFSAKKLEWSLGVYAMYGSIGALDGAKKIQQLPIQSWSSTLAEVIREQVMDRFREAAIASTIQTLTPVRDETSREFLSIYDANPYPRWRSLDYPMPSSLDAMMAQVRPGESPTSFERAGVLIAGCGTGQHPIQAAIAFPKSKVTALDFSLPALAYAARMAEAMEVSSIRFVRGDVMELASVQEKFALIECLGVLHHVKDSAGALAILRDRLMPRGLLKIGVYSKTVRQIVAPARELVKRLRVKDDASGVREARRAIMSLPANSAERGVLASPDFYATSTCRFLAFPLDEHVFTLAELEAMIDSAGLRFLGWSLPLGTIEKFKQVNPAPEAMLDFKAWDAFEQKNPSTFEGMYQMLLEARV